MRAAVAEADRRLEVREAARAWQSAGAIDEATRAKIDAAYPDDRRRLGPIFRVLAFVFTLVVLQSGLGIVLLIAAHAGEAGAGALFLVVGLSLVALTEVQQGPLKRRQGGTEPATATLAVSVVVGASLFLFFLAVKPGEDLVINTALLFSAAVLAAAGYRWGYTAFVALATALAFVLMARLPFGRLLWAAVPLGLAPLAIRASDSGRLPPAQRRSCAAVAVIALAFLYLAVHLASWDLGVVEMLTGRWRHFGAERPFRPFFIAATSLLPVAIVGWGVAARRRLLVNTGLVALLASIVTLRAYVHVAPLWVALIGGGATAIVLALLVRRYLDSGPGRERGGFTAEPLFTDPEARSALEVAAGVAAFTPSARPVEQPGFQGGGGRSGGAGASGTF